MEQCQLIQQLASGYTFNGWSLVPSDYQQVDYIEAMKQEPASNDAESAQAE